MPDIYLYIMLTFMPYHYHIGFGLLSIKSKLQNAELVFLT